MSYQTTSANPELIIDPGHGGRDPGGGSNSHWLEKDLVLKISLYQYKRYKELGIPVAITRTSDVYISPAQRAKIVRDSRAKYCHSNHINAGGGDGAEVYHSIYNSTNMAALIMEEMKKAGQNSRGVKTRRLPNNSKLDFYFMLRDTGNVSTCIIEYGFADSPRDDIQQLLNDWQLFAESVVKAYCRSTGRKYTAPSGQVTKPSTPSKPAPSKPSTGSFIGKRVESIYGNNNDPVVYRNKPTWNQKDVVGSLPKGYGFPTILDKVKVGSAYQYKVKNSNNQIFYVTAASKYVRVVDNKSATPKPKQVEIVGVTSSAIVMDRSNRSTAKRLGTVAKGAKLPLYRKVTGQNSSTGYWEINYNGKKGYITGKFGRQV